MSTPLNDLVTAERRLASLRLLVDSTGYTASADLLQMVLHKMGLGVSHDGLAVAARAGPDRDRNLPRRDAGQTGRARHGCGARLVGHYCAPCRDLLKQP